MNIDILTLFPEMFETIFEHSIIKRSVKKDIVNINTINIRDFSTKKHKNVDDYPYGGQSGMVMMAEPIVLAIESLQRNKKYDEIIFLTPDGETYNQNMANQLSLNKNILLLCGHYKGVDQRVRDHWITKEISIGDYVLSGGEIPAMILVDSIVRLVPGVLNDETSALSDSFQNNLLSPPVYTRPSDFRGYKVPDVLLSGNQKEIDNWYTEQSVILTKKKRPDIYKK